MEARFRVRSVVDFVDGNRALAPGDGSDRRAVAARARRHVNAQPPVHSARRQTEHNLRDLGPDAGARWWMLGGYYSGTLGSAVSFGATFLTKSKKACGLV